MRGRVLGVDGCPDGWVGIAPDPDVLRAYAAPTLDRLIAQAEADGELAWVGVDIPIGLSDRGRPTWWSGGVWEHGRPRCSSPRSEAR